jgi:hypothetical protein
VIFLDILSQKEIDDLLKDLKYGKKDIGKLKYENRNLYICIHCYKMFYLTCDAYSVKLIKGCNEHGHYLVNVNKFKERYGG